MQSLGVQVSRLPVPMHRLLRVVAQRLDWRAGPRPVRPRTRGAAPSMDREALRAADRLSGMDRRQDTFVLTRILGNDLEPRHARGQTRRNLQFILDNEPPLPHCEKRWIVNRIVDPDEEAAIIALLEARGARYLRIPFDWSAYAARPWNLDPLPITGPTYSRTFQRLSPSRRNSVWMHLYRHKNVYVMNNNGARNVALEDGRSAAKWVLPWDGNCFLTAEAWAEVVEAVAAQPELRYFVVPMARVTDNTLLRDPGFRPAAAEEPQILFRCDARETFDERYVYGRRPKVELLWRLGVSGPWDDWPVEAWDLSLPGYSEEAGQFAQAGWVARLFSGQAHLENDRERGHVVRGDARADAVIGMLDRLDARVLASRRGDDALAIYDEAALDRPRAANAPGPWQRVLETLRREADAALTRGPYSVVDKTTLPPSGDRHDYWHPAPYYWPNPITPSGRPYIPRDGRRVPGTRMYEPDSEKYDRTRLQRLFDDTTTLALAAWVFGDPRYAAHARGLIHCWFVGPETRMNPHLAYAQVRLGHDGDRGTAAGIIETKDFYYFLDAVRLLTRLEALDVKVRDGLRAWLDEYQTWLLTSDQGRREIGQVNNHGTYYDLQVGAIAAYLGETQVLSHTLRRARERIFQQFAPDGRQPEEMKRPTSAHYCCFNLQGWVHLARLAEAFGEDLWSFEEADGCGLRRGLDWLLARVDKPWPGRQIDAFDTDRFAPLRHAYALAYGPPAREDGEALPAPHEVKALFHPHDGIRPFWSLA